MGVYVRQITARYQFGFNGQLKDNEIYGEGNAYSFEYRIQDPRLVRFLSVDPLGREYPWNSPYSFAENRTIDGIDLEGLEYLSSNEARVQYMQGKLVVKVENLHSVSQQNIQKLSNDHHNWPDGSIGVDLTILDTDVNFKSPLKPDYKTAEAESIPNEQHPKTVQAMGENSKLAVVSEGINRQGRRDIKYNRTKSMSVKLNQSPNTNVGRAMGILTIITLINETYERYLIGDDNVKIFKHTILAKEAAKDVQIAVNSNMIDSKFYNKKDLADIMNVVLQGNSDSKNPEIQKIGKTIFNEISKPKIEKIISK